MFLREFNHIFKFRPYDFDLDVFCVIIIIYIPKL